MERVNEGNEVWRASELTERAKEAREQHVANLTISRTLTRVQREDRIKKGKPAEKKKKKKKKADPGKGSVNVKGIQKKQMKGNESWALKHQDEMKINQ